MGMSMILVVLVWLGAPCHFYVDGTRIGPIGGEVSDTVLQDSLQCLTDTWSSMVERVSKAEAGIMELKKDNAKLMNTLDAHRSRFNAIEGQLKEVDNCVKNDEEYQSIMEWVNDQRKKGFRTPRFVSDWFIMKSQDKKLSEHVVAHGLGSLPNKVDVLVQPTDGVNKGWKFHGVSAFQTDDDAGHDYGGVVYFYNETHVRLFAPNKANGKTSGSIICTGSDKKQTNFQISNSAKVMVKVWSADDMPKPDFETGWLPLDITDKSRTFYELNHGLGDYPALVTVQVNPSKTSLISDGVGAGVTYRSYVHGGGVVWGYSDKAVRVWVPYWPRQGTTEKYYGKPVCINDGWGLKWSLQNSGISVASNSASFKVRAWSMKTAKENNKFFTTYAKKTTASRFGPLSSESLPTDDDILTCYAEAGSGPNKGYRFSGYGGSQEDTSEGSGCNVFAYNDKGFVRAWPPNKSNKGRLIYIPRVYGNQTNFQLSDDAKFACTFLKTLKV